MVAKEAKTKIEVQLSDLFHLLRAVDESRIPEDMRNLIKFLVARLEEIQIRMDGDKNHATGHVHIKYRKDGHAASYAINNGSRLAGEMPRCTIKKWIADNRADLSLLWNSVQHGQLNQNLLLKFQTTVYD